MPVNKRIHIQFTMPIKKKKTKLKSPNFAVILVAFKM